MIDKFGWAVRAIQDRIDELDAQERPSREDGQICSG